MQIEVKQPALLKVSTCWYARACMILNDLGDPVNDQGNMVLNNSETTYLDKSGKFTNALASSHSPLSQYINVHSLLVCCCTTHHDKSCTPSEHAAVQVPHTRGLVVTHLDKGGKSASAASQLQRLYILPCTLALAAGHGLSSTL